MHLPIASIRSKASRGFSPKSAVRIASTIRDRTKRLDHIEVLFLSIQIGRGIGGFRTFLRLIEPPIPSIEIEMVVTAPRVRTPHAPLQIAGEHIPQHGVPAIATERPGVVLARAKIKVIKSLGTLIAEHWITQFTLPIVTTKEKPKRMLGIV